MADSKSNLIDSVEKVIEYLSSESVKPNLPFTFDKLDVKRLAGGYINYTYRIKYDNNNTVIMKNYPIFAACSVEVPLFEGKTVPIERYFVEKETLRILGEDPCFNG